jgi:hypothetical protein
MLTNFYLQNLRNLQYQIVIASPEMCLDHAGFREILSEISFNKHISHLVVDEAHCISQWGPEFRPAWGQLYAIRNLLKLGTPCIAQSATMGPGVIEEVRKTLNIVEGESLHVNLGNDRPNITQLLVRMTYGSRYEELGFLLDGLKSDGTGKMPRTLTFFEERDQAHEAANWLRSQLPVQTQEARSRIAYIHAGLTREGRKKIMHDFRHGLIDILCATECVGMGSDIPDIDIIVLFKLPANMSVLLQRIGRAGRGRQPARAVIFVEPTAYQVKKATAGSAAADSAEDELPAEDAEAVKVDGKLQYRKKVEPYLRTYIQATTCRRFILNEYFKNPPLPSLAATRPLCCDVCLAAVHQLEQPTLQQMWAILDSVSPLPSWPPLENPQDSFRHGVSFSALKRGRDLKPADARKGDHLDKVIEGLEAWRESIFDNSYPWASFGPEGILGKSMIKVLSEDSSVENIEDLLALPGFKGWHFISHAPHLLETIAKIDAAEREQCRVNALRRAECHRLQQLKNEKKRKAIADLYLQEGVTKRRRQAIEYAEWQKPTAGTLQALRPPAMTLPELPSQHFLSSIVASSALPSTPQLSVSACVPPPPTPGPRTPASIRPHFFTPARPTRLPSSLEISGCATPRPSDQSFRPTLPVSHQAPLATPPQMSFEPRITLDRFGQPHLERWTPNQFRVLAVSHMPLSAEQVFELVSRGVQHPYPPHHPPPSVSCLSSRL